MSERQPDEESFSMVRWEPPLNDTWKDILRPVTIFQLLQAESSPIFDDKSLVIEGRGFATVTLVAHLTSVEMQPNKACCILEDGTGRMYADKEFDSLRFRVGGLAEAEEAARYSALVHTYVEILGIPKKYKRTKLSITTIHPVNGYHQVMYHVLNVIHSSMLTEQHMRPYLSGEDLVSNEHMVISAQAHQDDADTQDCITYAIPDPHTILPSTFSPQRHHLYAALKPLERVIMKYICHHKGHPVLDAQVAQAVQASCGCTEVQFNVAFRTLLSEAYITSPLDDGYVVITPRH